MEQQMYFIKNPKMSDVKAGRKPVRVRRAGKTRIVAEDDIATRREMVMPSAQQKLIARVAKAQERQREKMFKPTQTPTEQLLRKQLLDQTIVQQQQKKMEDDTAAIKLLEERSKSNEMRKAITELPGIMERVSQNHLLALERVAPDIAAELIAQAQGKTRQQVLDEKKQQQEALPFSGEPIIVEPTKREEKNTQKDSERRAILEKIINDEGIQRPVDIAARYKQLSGEKRMFNQYMDMVKDIKAKGKPAARKSRTPSPKFVIQSSSESDSDTGSGLKMRKTKGAGFFSSLKNLAQKAVEKAVDVIKDDPIGNAKKAFELGKQAKSEYSKLFGKKEAAKGGMLTMNAEQSRRMHRTMNAEQSRLMHKLVQDAVMKRHQLSKEHAGGFADMFLSGLRAPFDAIAKIPILKDIPIIKQATQIVPGIANAIGVKRVLI